MFHNNCLTARYSEFAQFRINGLREPPLLKPNNLCVLEAKKPLQVGSRVILKDWFGSKLLQDALAAAFAQVPGDENKVQFASGALEIVASHYQTARAQGKREKSLDGFGGPG